MAHEVRPGEIVIEIDEEKVNKYETRVVDPFNQFDPHKTTVETREVVSGNSNVAFFPTEGVLRGRIHMSRFNTKNYYPLDRATNEIPELPGQRIHIDREKRIGRITDGMGAPENEAIYRAACKAGHAMESLHFYLQLLPEQEVKLKDSFALWNWLFWMRQIVDQGCAMPDGTKPVPRTCRPIQGVESLPSYEECIRSGFVRAHWNELDIRTEAAMDVRRAKYEPGYKDDPKPGILTPELMGIA